MVKIIDMKENKDKKNAVDLFAGLEGEILNLSLKYSMWADVLYTYSQCVRECLPEIADLLEVDVADLIMEKGNLIDMEEGLQSGEFLPLVFRVSKEDEKYVAMLFVAEDDDSSEDYVFGRSLEKYKGTRCWSYNFGGNFWEEESDVINPYMRDLLDSGAPEKDFLAEIMCTYDGEIDMDEYLFIKFQNNILFSLYNETNKYMNPLCVLSEEGETELYLKSRDKNRFGFLVGCSGSEYVLYQYLSPIEIGVNRNVSREFFKHLIAFSLEEYIKEIGRTSDPNEIKKCLRILANRYTDSVIYTIPLSLNTYAESDDLKNIGKQVYSIDGDEKHELTAEEKKASESVRKYVKKLC